MLHTCNLAVGSHGLLAVILAAPSGLSALIVELATAVVMSLTNPLVLFT